MVTGGRFTGEAQFDGVAFRQIASCQLAEGRRAVRDQIRSQYSAEVGCNDKPTSTEGCRPEIVRSPRRMRGPSFAVGGRIDLAESRAKCLDSGNENEITVAKNKFFFGFICGKDMAGPPNSVRGSKAIRFAHGDEAAIPKGNDGQSLRSLADCLPRPTHPVHRGENVISVGRVDGAFIADGDEYPIAKGQAPKVVMAVQTL